MAPGRSSVGRPDPKIVLRIDIERSGARTSSRPAIPAVFAAGDVRAGSSEHVAAAVGEGSWSVVMVHRYLETV